MLSYQQAREIITKETRQLQPVPQLLRDCRQQVLHQDVVTDSDLPAFDRSAMDGYAVLATESLRDLRIAGEQRPGAGDTPTMSPGDCIRILTGAKVPDGCVVVRQEDVDLRDNSITLLINELNDGFVLRQAHIRKAGDTILKAGTKLGAPELAVLASAGLIEPLTSPIPRIAHLVTGDEIIPPYAVPREGQIRDSNSILIRSLIEGMGAQIAQQVRFGDNFEALDNKLRGFIRSKVDCILISGGASEGDYDFGHELLIEEGFTIHYRRVAVRPGKPLIFGTLKGLPAFVIPGNPASHHLSFRLFIRLAIQCLRYKTDPTINFATGILNEDFDYKPNQRHTFWPADYKYGADGLQVTPHPWNSSGDMIALTKSNALISIEPPGQALKKGDTVQLLMEP